MEKLKLLIVDDEKEIVENLLFDLRKLDMEIDFAYDGAEALSKYFKHKHHCILTDVKMPLLNGIELGQKIRSFSEDTALIYYTSHQSPSIYSLLKSNEPIDIIEKPAKKTDLEYLLTNIAGEYFDDS